MLNCSQSMRLSLMMLVIVAGINGAASGSDSATDRSPSPNIVVVGETSIDSLQRSRSMSDIPRALFFYPDPSKPVPLVDCMREIKDAENDSGSLKFKATYGTYEALLTAHDICSPSRHYDRPAINVSWGRFLAGMMPAMLAIAAGSYLEYDIKKLSQVAALLSCVPLLYGVYEGVQKVTIPWDNFNKKQKEVHDKLSAQFEQFVTIDSRASCVDRYGTIPANRQLSARNSPTFATEVHQLFMETKDETKVPEVMDHNRILAYNLHRVINSVCTDKPQHSGGGADFSYTQLEMSELDQHLLDPAKQSGYRDGSSRFLQNFYANWKKFQCNQENEFGSKRNNRAWGWGLGGAAGIVMALKYFDTFAPKP